MLTYLVIVLAVLCMGGIFLHRNYVLQKYGLPEEPVLEKAVPEKEEKVKKKRVSKEMKEEIAALCSKGDNLLKYGKDDEAIKCFVQALALDEFNKETQHRLAMLYLKKEMYSAAGALFKQLGSVTNDPGHFSHLGLSLYQQSDYSGALKAYQKAVDLDKSRPQRFVSLAQVYKSMGRLFHAVMALEKAIEIDENNVDYLFFLANIQFEMGNYEDCERILKGVLALEEFPEAKKLIREVRKMLKEQV